MAWICVAFVLLCVRTALALPYFEEYVDWNLNQNQSAAQPLDYWGEWSSDHTYHPSPANWRFPIYTITLDRWVNGNPGNDESNGTQWEHDPTSNQFRYGGDVTGLLDSLDYLQGMGIKGLYLAGSPFINAAWASDGYSPLDLTLLDPHHGTIAEWQAAITEIHSRGMYVILDNTMATMGDLIGFQGYLNDTSGTPFSYDEHDFIWKTDRQYWDFQPSNEYNASCAYPNFWYSTGAPVGTNVTSQFVGCKSGEFDQYGEVSAFGEYPDWQKQTSKFAFVQDRLREWVPSVRAKLERFSCITIAMLDIDGFRMDKALQITVDAQAEWSKATRECARTLGKDNFFITGEVVNGNVMGALYFGRGLTPDAAFSNLTKAVMATNSTNSTDALYMRDYGTAALDSAAFHYSIYRGLTVFLGMDGEIGAVGDTDYNMVNAWHQIVETNDLVNSNTGVYDPRHMFGVTNQDVFRYPSLTNGTQKEILGLFITTLHQPGIPLTVWGEEQAFYVLDNQASNYVFGRSPMASANAWQMHGCYKLGEIWYNKPPFDSALTACNDDSISLDHRDSSHPVRNILKRMYQLRDSFPALNDGFELTALSNKTYQVLFPGSGNRTTEFGVWSVLRSRTDGVQDFTGQAQGNQSVWFIYTNQNETAEHTFNCSSSQEGMISPFPANTTVRNLMYPYEEYTLNASTQVLGFEGSTEFNGCIDSLTLDPWSYKVLVPIAKFVEPLPVITRVLPGHDSRMNSTGSPDIVPIEIHFSMNMTCDTVTQSLYFNSTTENNESIALDSNSVNCVTVETDEPLYVGAVPTVFIYKANLTNVYNGVHMFTVNNVSSSTGLYTNSIDHFMFRIGQQGNPMVFLKSNVSDTILYRNEDNSDLYIVPNAAGADKFRYSLTWGSTWSDWLSYNSSNYTLEKQVWTGTTKQQWDGEHVILEYWSRLTGSADHRQHGELAADRKNLPARQFPHVFAQGAWNQYGYDSGLPSTLTLVSDNLWSFKFMAEWPNTVAFNVWGVNPDKSPDQTLVFGDVDGDGILDRVPPVTLLENNISLATPPKMPYLSYRLTMNDKTLGYTIEPIGSAWKQLALFLLMLIIPPITGAMAVFFFKKSFYGVKHNYIGVSEKQGVMGAFKKVPGVDQLSAGIVGLWKDTRGKRSVTPAFAADDALAADAGAENRRKVLIATMEYEIEDWAIKIKIGGLGVMASLMGKNLGHQDLIWVVPCVGGIDYPMDEEAEPMQVTVIGGKYDVQVQYHVVRNITYVLLDAPVFRGQSKSEPYPPRMDDVDSAVYYSVWNQCIGEAIRRFNPNIYHINDYHGTVAPLYLLPKTIPACLSLHNAEFQGLWPMRTQKEIDEVCAIYNLPIDVAKKYVQFGEVFNLLHAGASYLRVHQKGFGAVGVSKKYGVRSFARYSIFWGLSKIGALPNPDPSDQAAWDRNEPQSKAEVVVDAEAEAARGPLRVQAQEWAGLKVDPTAELFVFVGRWSMQKGVDLIADVFPSVLEENPKVQLICVGPVIDLYGKFAAMKLEKMMTKYPGRVCSKPVFTMLPPFIFSGAEFALIPSRDEPFGLVAVEFGRKGALGVGARVGGLGQMPGWWFTIESTTTKHLMKQFKMAIRDAMASKTEVRAMMRARSALQRFPVAQWVEDLGTLQSKSIVLHEKYSSGNSSPLANDPLAMELALPRPVDGVQSSASSVYSIQSTTNRIMQSSWFGPGRKHSAQSTQPSSRAPSRVGSSLFADSRQVSEVTISTGVSGKQRKRLSKQRKTGRVIFSPGDDDEESDDDDMASPPGPSRQNSYGMSQLPSHSRETSRGSTYPAPAEPSLRQLQDDIVDSYGRRSAGSPFLDPSRSGASSPNPPFASRSRANSMLSLASVDAVIGERKDFKLQAVDPFFTDSSGVYGGNFETMLNSLDGKTSEGQLCIEDYLKKSEKQWYSRMNDAKLGVSSPAGSMFHWGNKSASSLVGNESRPDLMVSNGENAEFGLRDNHVVPTGLKRIMQLKIGDWPVYAFILAFGQIIAANSYQITLLIGQNGEQASELYTIASIYLGASITWWVLFRHFKAVFVLSTPFIFYGMAFFLVGMVPYASSSSKVWVQNVATAFYAIASSSGSLFFALNFGSEGGAAVESWAFRACVIQGTQQIYVSLLWLWGSKLTASIANGVQTSSMITSQPAITGVTTPIALLLWACGALLFFGLPNFYRQKPGTVPSFYRSVCRRKIIGWFLVMVVLQNYWLSAPYGRNWTYLWSSKHAPKWAIVLLVFVFFVVIWAGFMFLFGQLSKADSWIIPLFAIGLGAPRWCQMLWGISNIGLYIPWAGSATSGALLGRCLWLWLGVLDAVQGVGFGMILLQTLTRLHVTFALIAAQVIGSLATIAARASAPNKTGPGTVFPDFSGGFSEGLSEPNFWLGLIFQGIICIGFFVYFRKEQLFKP
ncbi:glycosyltransferase family 5 protein [Coleophoma cylindrospora]|uniref:alpha-1,3-glucan synthase n=1 Tax=Coleophoma cylindrospora TaxID=1849047 RepID=A0A3D8RN56_9HELO|nr:glycosyltransferase family 5 protein [Coleophoma cylindrospora]